MESGATPAEARAALRGLTDARLRLAERLDAPWWYRTGAAACTALLFVGAGAGVGVPGEPNDGTWAMASVVVGAIIGPTLLVWALRRTTGVSVERYAESLRPWYVAMAVLFALGLGLQYATALPAMAFAAAPAFVATLVNERRLDHVLRRRLTEVRDVGAAP